MVRINWHTWNLDNHDGYGRQAINMLRALSNMGHDMSPLTEEMIKQPGWLQRLLGVDWSCLTISNVSGDFIKSHPGRQWAFSMWEDNCIPEEWAVNINAHCERLLVPCAHNAIVFKLGGVKIPVHIVPLGIDSREYAPLPLAKRNRCYTFLTIGDRALRKGWDQVLVAFSAAFPSSKYPDVRLVIKTREAEKLVGFGDSRISHWEEDCPSSVDMFAQADCLVFPSKGEGWGLPPREAIALGVPAIVPRHTGLEAGIDCWATVILEKGVLAQSQLGHGGSWYEPDYQEIADAMTWCYEHQEEARQKAIGGGEWLRREQTWDHAAQILTALLEAHGG